MHQEEEEVTTVEFVFAMEDVVFKKPSAPVNHLKPLHVKGHINGTLVHNMLVDSGAIVNLMPYLLFKKLGGKDKDLVKTNMMISGVGGGEPLLTKGVATMELTIGNKTLPIAFFIVEVRGSYNLILGRDWIHANQCVPSSLHQILIEWVGDSIKVVHVES
jgi:hypothetical protein